MMPLKTKAKKVKSAQEMVAMGAKLGAWILSQPSFKESALVLALNGDLGTGKTTFVQGLAKGLGVKERITSPTFVVMRKYKIQETSPKKPRRRSPQARPLQGSPRSRTSSLRGRQDANKSQIQNYKFKTFYHIDAYRLKSAKDADVLGLKEILAYPKNIVAIEWPAVLIDILPMGVAHINLGHSPEGNRLFNISLKSSKIMKGGG